MGELLSDGRRFPSWLACSISMKPGRMPRSDELANLLFEEEVEEKGR